MKVEQGSFDGKMKVEKNGQQISKRSLEKSGKFEAELDYNADYILSFYQDDYVTKKIRVNTKVPEERREEGFLPFEFQVTLFKQYEGVNTVLFNQPVGFIKYSDEVDDFDYDTDYTKSIQDQLADILKQVEEKQKEEEKEAKRLAKEEKKKEEPKEEEPAPPPPDPEPEKEEPITRQVRDEPPPSKPKSSWSGVSTPKRKTANLVVMKAYTIGEQGFPNLPAYGFINFGDGTGPREISKEQFQEYAKQYR